MIQSINVPLEIHRDEIVEWLAINSPESSFCSLVTSHQADQETGIMTCSAVANVIFSPPDHAILFKLTWGGS